METIPCPGCTTALDPSATVCPVCTRPRGKIEITRAYATLRQVKKERQKRPFIIAGYLLAAGAASGLVYRYQAPIMAATATARAHVGQFFNMSLDSAGPAVNRDAAPPPAPDPAQMTTPTPPPAAPRFIQNVPPPVAPAAANRRPAHVEDLPLPSFDSTTQWAFHGRVYDLTTLLPVPNAQLNFTLVQGSSRGSSGIVGGARSDADGRFAVVLRRLKEGSYEIHAACPGYTPAVLYEPDIPYARLPLAKRHAIAHNAQDGDVALPPLTDVADESSIRRDVFLAPSR